MLYNNKKKLALHLVRNTIFGLLFIAIALVIGILGYRYFEHLSWIDSFLNASMILSGMGPANELKSTSGKLFSGCYALFSGLAFIACVAVIFAPLLRVFLIKIHLDVLDDQS